MQKEHEAKKACQRDERNYMAKVVLALVYAHKKQIEDARSAINDALQLRPGLRCVDVQALIGRRGVQLLRASELLN